MQVISLQCWLKKLQYCYQIFLQFPDTHHGQVCEFVFGRGICCNGVTQLADPNTDPPINQTLSKSCYFYDCFSGNWTEIASTPSALIYHSANKIMHKGRDYKWMIAGGEGN